MANSNQHSTLGILVRSHLMWLRGFLESTQPDVVPKVDMALGRLEELEEQLQTAERERDEWKHTAELLSRDLAEAEA